VRAAKGASVVKGKQRKLGKPAGAPTVGTLSGAGEGQRSKRAKRE
jgi:hypothetical protein